MGFSTVEHGIMDDIIPLTSIHSHANVGDRKYKLMEIYGISKFKW